MNCQKEIMNCQKEIMNYQKEIEYLKSKDIKLATIFPTELDMIVSDDDIYGALMSAIISQQISTAAANSIKKRFLEFFKNTYPDIETVLNTNIETLKSLGLSTQKASYIKNVAIFYQKNSLTNRELLKLNDEQLIEKLTQIKGVGIWTVEMILMFKLARPDVFALDDLGLINGVVKLYSLKKTKTLKKRIEKISKRWSPYRSVASRYIWAYKDKK